MNLRKYFQILLSSFLIVNAGCVSIQNRRSKQIQQVKKPEQVKEAEDFKLEDIVHISTVLDMPGLAGVSYNPEKRIVYFVPERPIPKDVVGEWPKEIHPKVQKTPAQKYFPEYIQCGRSKIFQVDISGRQTVPRRMDIPRESWYYPRYGTLLGGVDIKSEKVEVKDIAFLPPDKLALLMMYWDENWDEKLGLFYLTLGENGKFVSERIVKSKELIRLNKHKLLGLEYTLGRYRLNRIMPQLTETMRIDNMIPFENNLYLIDFRDIGRNFENLKKHAIRITPDGKVIKLEEDELFERFREYMKSYYNYIMWLFNKEALMKHNCQYEFPIFLKNNTITGFLLSWDNIFKDYLLQKVTYKYKEQK